MSFFNKLRSGNASSQAAITTQNKKDPNAPQPTLLEKHLGDLSGPVRADGSDKFFGFENYGSTCYCNSIMQSLYYSPHFRDYVLNYPSQNFIAHLSKSHSGLNGTGHAPGAPSSAPYPNPTSPARKTQVPGSPGPGAIPPKAEESKESPEYKKRMAIQNGPVLEMTSDNSNKYFMQESLFTSLREIFEGIVTHDSRSGVVSPHRFLEILRRENEMFRSAMHQDAHEFFGLLLNQVVDTLEAFSKKHDEPEAAVPGKSTVSAQQNGNSSLASTSSSHIPGPSWIRDLFEGLLTSETRCLTCENTSQKDEPFLDLSVDLDAHTSVTSCLRKFSEEEMLCEQNKFHCDNCGGLQEAEKRMKIKRLPQILALHLKRFTYTEDLQRLQKLFHRVVYPFYLRLFNTTDDIEDSDRLYELYAVVVHIGSGPYHGHYVSIIKTQDHGWLLFDDELVEPVDQNYVLNFFGGDLVPGAQDARQLACAYVLFYQQTTTEAMLRDQEMNGQPTAAAAAAAARSSDVEINKDSSLSTNDIHRVKTHVRTPGQETESIFPPHHLQTEPNRVNVATSPRGALEGLLGSPQTTVLSGKTKKEIKAEEKERKAREKAEIKATEQLRREASMKRVENMRKEGEDLRRVMEESKSTADDDSRKRGETVAPERTSAFSRFRHSSLSLRGRPKLSSVPDSAQERGKGPDTDANDSSAILEEDLSSNGDAALAGPSTGEVNGHIQFSPQDTSQQNGTAGLNGHNHDPDTPGTNVTGGEKKLRHRFSLGRKKSQAISSSS